MIFQIKVGAEVLPQMTRGTLRRGRIEKKSRCRNSCFWIKQENENWVKNNPEITLNIQDRNL